MKLKKFTKFVAQNCGAIGVFESTVLFHCTSYIASGIWIDLKPMSRWVSISVFSCPLYVESSAFMFYNFSAEIYRSPTLKTDIGLSDSDLIRVFQSIDASRTTIRKMSEMSFFLRYLSIIDRYDRKKIGRGVLSTEVGRESYDGGMIILRHEDDTENPSNIDHTPEYIELKTRSQEKSRALRQICGIL